MASHSDICTRWVERELKAEAQPNYPRRRDGSVALTYDRNNIGTRSNIIAEDGRLWSYGRHFELARPLRSSDGTMIAWLLNGDGYSVSTAKHQGHIRAAIRSASDLPAVILPYSPLESANIDKGTIRVLGVSADRMTPTFTDCHGCGEYREADARDDESHARFKYGRHTVYAMCDGTRPHLTWRHELGGSVFTADVAGYAEGVGHFTRTGVRFLSSFDRQEARQTYFLCELPATSRATTEEEALADLQPATVAEAIAAGATVSRQGDMFAVCEPTMTTAQLRRASATVTRRGKGTPGATLCGTAHTATEVAVTDGAVYARGCFYHDPSLIGEGWRTADHARRRIGDGKVWARVYPNTVPRGTLTLTDAGAPRAWVRSGAVD